MHRRLWPSQARSRVHLDEWRTGAALLVPALQALAPPQPGFARRRLHELSGCGFPAAGSATDLRAPTSSRRGPTGEPRVPPFPLPGLDSKQPANQDVLSPGGSTGGSTVRACTGTFGAVRPVSPEPNRPPGYLLGGSPKSARTAFAATRTWARSRAIAASASGLSYAVDMSATVVASASTSERMSGRTPGLQSARRRAVLALSAAAASGFTTALNSLRETVSGFSLSYSVPNRLYALLTGSTIAR